MRAQMLILTLLFAACFQSVSASTKFGKIVTKKTVVLR